MEVFVARQPIFDRKKNVYGYELLFRSSLENFFDTSTDPDMATSRVIVNSVFMTGMETMTGGRKAFINFPRNMLLREFATFLPRDTAVVEVLEDVKPDLDILAVCAKLRKIGYLIALDDVVALVNVEAFANVADIVKIDFLHTNQEQREELAREFAARGVKLLAEKVETQEDFDTAVDLGCEYFQGYFFCKPVVLAHKDIPAWRLNYLRILNEIHRGDMNFDRIADIIKTDVSLSYKMLTYINSVVFGWRTKIESIRHALVLMGELELRKWASLFTLAGMTQEKPTELMVCAAIRAKVCEDAASRSASLRGRKFDCFMMGMFSVLDAILDRPLDEALKRAPLADDVRDALLGQNGNLRSLFDSVVAYERGLWTTVTETSQILRLNETEIPRMYLDAVSWTNEVFGAQTGFQW